MPKEIHITTKNTIQLYIFLLLLIFNTIYSPSSRTDGFFNYSYLYQHYYFFFGIDDTNLNFFYYYYFYLFQLHCLHH